MICGIRVLFRYNETKYHMMWWHMMTSSNGTFHALLALCARNPPVRGEFLAQRPVARSFDVFFDLRPNKRLSKHSWGWWFETLSRSLWRHCDDRYTFYFLPVTASQIVSNVYLLLVWTSCWTNRWVAEGIRRHDAQCNEQRLQSVYIQLSETVVFTIWVLFNIILILFTLNVRYYLYCLQCNSRYKFCCMRIWFSVPATPVYTISDTFHLFPARYWPFRLHSSDVVMSAMASQIIGVSSACSTVCSGAEARKHHWSLWWKSTGDRWIPLTKDQ